MRKIAVFDTNILFSGVGWNGKPFQCLELARQGVVEGVTCREILDELAAKLSKKLSFTPETTLETVADLLTFLRVVTIAGQTKAVPADPDDDKILECAVVVLPNNSIRDATPPSYQESEQRRTKKSRCEAVQVMFNSTIAG